VQLHDVRDVQPNFKGADLLQSTVNKEKMLTMTSFLNDLRLFLGKSFVFKTKNSGFNKYLNSTLYKNSVYISSGKFLTIACGFLFWILAAKYYNIEDIGVATAILSSFALIMTFSKFGLDVSLIRFLPIGDRSTIINTTLIITSISSLILCIVFIIITSVAFPARSYHIEQYFLIFIIINLLYSITTILGIVTLAIKKGSYYFLQNLLMAIRIPILIPLAILGKFGIILAVGISYLVTLFALTTRLKKTINFKIEIDKNFLKNSFKYSSTNYLSGIFDTLPSQLMPILVLSALGPIENAKYYIAFAIGYFILIIPDAMSTSLFIEGSNGANLRNAFIKTLIGTYALIIPAIIFIFLFGDKLLGFFGEEYTDAFEFLKIIALSGFAFTLYYLYISIQNIKMNVKIVLLMNFTRIVLYFGLSYILIFRLGIIGIGIAWITTYTILCIFILINFFVTKFRSAPNSKAISPNNIEKSRI
jgi:O-antigen/teichoic acid export membrane protein